MKNDIDIAALTAKLKEMHEKRMRPSAVWIDGILYIDRAKEDEEPNFQPMTDED